MNLPIPLYYSNLTDHPMIQEIREINKDKNEVKYELSNLIGTIVKHFKRDIVNDEDRLRYVYRIENFVLDANDPAKILVIYSTIYPDYICENKTWARELCEFFSKVDKEKYPYSKEEYRFTRLLNIELTAINTINEKCTKREIKWNWLKRSRKQNDLEATYDIHENKPYKCKILSDFKREYPNTIKE